MSYLQRLLKSLKARSRGMAQAPGYTPPASSSSGGTPGGSNTQIQFNNSGAFGGSSEFVWNGSSVTLNDGSGAGQLWAGNIAGSTAFFNGQGAIQSRKEGQNNQMRLVEVGATGLENYLAFDRAQGTFASPTAILADDNFGIIIGVGFDGISAVMTHGPQLRLKATQTWTAANNGNAFEFYTTPNDSTTSAKQVTIGGIDGPAIAAYGPSSGSTTKPVRLVNANTATGTGVGIDFIPNGNTSYPFGCITVDRTSTSSTANLRLQTINAGNNALQDNLILNSDLSSTFSGSIVQTLAGAKISIKSGTNQRAGNATLVGGTVTVANTTVTANTHILLTMEGAPGGTAGAVYVTKINGTSFTINGLVTDTSTYAYFMVEVP